MERDDEQLIAAATKAYLQGESSQHPGVDSDVQVVGGVTYVVLRNSYQLLAVYEQRADGRLSRLEKWPATFND